MSKRWTLIFKALGNINRLKIIQILNKQPNLNVTQISERLGVTIKSASQHLVILHNLEIVEAEGKQGHVYYSLNKLAPHDIKSSIELFI